VKVVCSFCGHANRADAQVCSQCGAGLANAKRQGFKLPWVTWAPAIPIAAILCFQYAGGQKALAKLRAEAATTTYQVSSGRQDSIRELKEAHDSEQADLEAKHRAMLANKRFISGDEADINHQEEWERRQNHDPKLASTVLEKTLLEVERLGKDPALTAEAALRKVAELVTPPGSRIEVKPDDNGFIVRVAFRLGAVAPEEAGGATRHTSSAEVRKEIEESTAHTLKDLFDFTGARGIHRLSVSCNRALITGKDEHERLVMRSLYRAVIESKEAARVANWRTISPGQVAEIMQIEHDVISSIIITEGGKVGLRLDPNEPLEF
jgi:hypothetical protein